LLTKILDRLPNGFTKPTGLKIFSSSAALSQSLRRRARAKLATEVFDIYGSNEAGYVSSISDNNEFGSVWPGVQVEVVDDRDEPLPFGEVGRIRVKTDRMVQAYLDDAETTARVFKNGWFYAFDLGALHKGNRLQLVGRSDEILNISGQKLAPDVLEDLVVGIGKVSDVAACAIQNADGIEEIFIAVSGTLLPNQQQEIADALPYVGKIHFVTVDRIPRNQSGKIERSHLKARLMESRNYPIQERNF
jgi:acyl-coenzyme A synthetase/AMP-(fatty) acid ligase